jgi:hypothetical protein
MITWEISHARLTFLDEIVTECNVYLWSYDLECNLTR